MSNKKRYAIVLDASKCIDCKACTIACKMENNVPKGPYSYRIWVAEEPYKGHYPNIKRSFLPSQCQQCSNPPCVHVCPTKASYQTEDGVVLVDHDKCILCKYCMTACPYDARYESENVHAIDKCTFCYHRLPEGREPACVETCPPKVRVFGDLNDPESAVSKLLDQHKYSVLKPEKGTKPKLFYIV
jgi:Fe-S-cluster-containing dehydrogenase component